MPFELLDSNYVYTGRAFTVRRDHLRLPDDRDTWLDIIEHVGSVVVVPVDDLGNVLLVRQYRHATGGYLLELPAGTLNPGEAPEDCALREIREEIGMAAGKLEAMGGFFLAPGYSTEYMNVYLASDLHYSPLDPDVDEFLSVEKLALDEIFRSSANGLFPDAKSLAALYLCSSRLTQLSHKEK